MSISQLGKEHINAILDGTKINWYNDHVLAWQRGERVAPVTIDMALTTTCNMGCEFCVAPATKILMSDFTWKAIKDVKEGDIVIGFDEHKEKGKFACYYPTKVTATMKRKARLHRLFNKETGDYLFITNDHPVLCSGHRWRKPSVFKSADVRFFTSPYETDFRECYSYKLGYIKGILEGDGTFGKYKQDNPYSNKLNHKLKLQMNDLEGVQRCKSYLEELFNTKVCTPKDPRIITINTREVVDQIRDSIKWKESLMPSKEFARGYLAGIFDSEGSFCDVIRISQFKSINSIVCKNIEEALNLWGFKFYIEDKGYRIQGGYEEISRFFGQVKPSITRKMKKFYNKSIPSSLKVEHDHKACEEFVYNIETESHTYVANGFAVHNCYRYLQHNTAYKITKDHMTRFLDDCAEIGVKGVSLVSDGESSISPAYEHTINYGHSLGLSMASGTNAYLLGGDLLQSVFPNLTYLRVNISAGEQGRYDEIMGARGDMFERVCDNIRTMVSLKKQGKSKCTVGMQMVFKPDYEDQLIPLAELALKLEADYLIIKHCSDDEFGTLGVKYGDYERCYPTLQAAEALSNDRTLIKVKWSKIKECSEKGAIRTYQQCYGTPFLLQISGTGLVAPCGMLFNERYKHLHMGNITETSFKEIWQSERYWEIIRYLGSDKFNAQNMCGSLCLQHSVNRYLDDVVKGKLEVTKPVGEPPPHLGFL